MTTLQASVSKTATFNGASLDISAMKEFVLKIRVKSLTATSGVPSVQFQIQDSVDAFTANVVRHVFEFVGPINSPEGAVRSFHTREVPRLRKNTASAVMRLALTEIAANTTVVYEAWVEEIS